MPSTNSDSFTISFPSWIPFISFYSPIATARTSKTMLNKSGNEQFSSVTQLCLTFCHPMGSRPGFLFIINCWSLLKVMSIKSVMPSNNLILCCPFLFLSSLFPSIRVFSSGRLFASGGQHIGVSASSSILPMNIQDWFPLEMTGLISLQSKGLSRVFSNTTVQKPQFFGARLSL